MAVTTPAPSGSESIVGFVREATWGTTPTTGSDPNKTVNGIVFFPVKEESIQPGVNAEAQMDDMNANREISRIIENGASNTGSMRFIPGPETLGYLMTMIFGSPTTTEVAAPVVGEGAAPGVYSHVWYPGKNTRGRWPAPFSIESIYGAMKSKLIRGALPNRLPIEIPNNGPMMATPEFLAKNIIWLGTAADSKGSATTNTLGEARPAVMTASPTELDETPWHFKQITASPEIDDVAEEEITSLSLEFAFPGMEGLFTAGSGMDLGTYRVDNFQLSGRATIIFGDEAYWEKFKGGAYWKLKAALQGDLIRTITDVDHYNSLEVIAYSCKANDPATANKVGTLEYDLSWSARKDPTEGKSCQVTIVNSVASYKYPGEA